MNGASIKRALLLLLLSCALMAAQGLAFAHDFDHHPSGDNSSCVICPVGSNLESAAADSGNAFTQIAPITMGPHRFDPIARDAYSIVSAARAPPTFL